MVPSLQVTKPITRSIREKTTKNSLREVPASSSRRSTLFSCAVANSCLKRDKLSGEEREGFVDSFKIPLIGWSFPLRSHVWWRKVCFQTFCRYAFAKKLLKPHHCENYQLLRLAVYFLVRQRLQRVVMWYRGKSQEQNLSLFLIFCLCESSEGRLIESELADQNPTFRLVKKSFLFLNVGLQTHSPQVE